MRETGEHSGERASVVRRVVAWMVGILLLAVVAVVLIRVFIRPVPPNQGAPPGHFGGPCWACHLITSDAEPVETP